MTEVVVWAREENFEIVELVSRRAEVNSMEKKVVATKSTKRHKEVKNGDQRAGWRSGGG